MQDANPNVKVRPMEARDVEFCATVIAGAPLWQYYGVTVQGATDRLHAAMREGGALFVPTLADDSGRDPDAPRGMVWIAPRGMFDRSPYIRWIAVDAAQRSSGIGGALLLASEDYARTIATDLFLMCADFNTDARRFYERKGYTLIGQMPDYVAPNVVELIYRKRLVTG